MRRGRRHPDSKDIAYVPKGLNLTSDAVSLSPEEMPDCTNAVFQRGSGRLRNLEPLDLVATLPATPETLWSSKEYEGIFFSAGGHLYVRKTTGTTDLGALTGTNPAMFCDWGGDTPYVFVASGSTLQYYDGKLHTPDPGDMPVAADVMVQDGRLVAMDGTSDRITWSGIGDPFNWQSENEVQSDGSTDYWTDADAQWLDVGYKSGGTNMRMVMQSRDLLVFRSNGRLFRITGTYPDWIVTEVATDCVPASRLSAVPSGTDVLYLDMEQGIRSVVSAETYGEMAVSGSIADPVNATIMAHTTSDARIWVLDDRGEVWVRPNAANKVYVYSTLYRGWTKLDLGSPVSAVVEADDGVYVAVGTALCRLDDAATDIYLRPSLSVSLKPSKTHDAYVVTRMEFRGDVDDGATATLTVGSLSMPLADMKSKWCCYRTEEIAPVITSSGGTTVIREVRLEVAET